MKFITSDLMSLGMPFLACSNSVASSITQKKFSDFANHLYQSIGSSKNGVTTWSFIGPKESEFASAVSSASRII